MAKIIDLFTGKEIKGPELLACYKRAPAKFLAPIGERRQGVPSFTNAGEIALRDILPDLKRRMPR